MHKYNIKEEELDSTLWRYMDLSKFIDFLENSHLFLPSVDLFEDKFEGIHNAIGENDFFDITNQGEIIRIDHAIDQRQKENSEKLKNFISSQTKQISKAVGVSCWRLSKYESHAMWKIFLSSDEGVVIKTKISKLVENIKSSHENLKLEIGKVNYIDYSNEKIPIHNMFAPIFYKNIYFEHEKELRIIAYSINNKDIGIFDEGNLKPLENKGTTLGIDYKSIIEEIIVSPYAPEWFYKLVKKVASDKYGLNVPVRWSMIELN